MLEEQNSTPSWIRRLPFFNVEWQIAARYFWSASVKKKQDHRLSLSLLILTLCCAAFLRWVVRGPSVFHLLVQYACYVFGFFFILQTIRVICRRHLNRFTTISVMGFILSTSVLILILSISSPMQEKMTQDMLSGRPHLRITSASHRPLSNYEKMVAQIRALPQVEAASAYVETEVMLRNPQIGASSVSIVHGVNLKEHAKVILGLPGQWRTPVVDPKQPKPLDIIHRPILLGTQLYDKLTGNQPWGSEEKTQRVDVQMTYSDWSPHGISTQSVSFYVNDLLWAVTGPREFHQYRAYISLEQAQVIAHMPQQVTGILVRLHEREAANTVRSSLRTFLPPDCEIEIWQEMNALTLSGRKLEKFSVTLLLILTAIIAAFSVVSAGMTIVAEKRKQIAVLKNYGATSQLIQRIFLCYGMLMGVCGALVGGGLGMLMCVVLDKMGLPLSSDFPFEKFPIAVSAKEVLLVIGGSMALIVMGMWYPSKLASKI